jgi:hypothetical protein
MHHGARLTVTRSHKVYDGRILAGFAFHLLACANTSSSGVCKADASTDHLRVSKV